MSWAKKNARRCDLIHKEVYDSLNAEEAAELKVLQELAYERIRTVGGLTADIKALEDRVRAAGLHLDEGQGMPDKIDSRGTHMTVRPTTDAEMLRWPDAEIAFTIHYAVGGVKAHVLTKIEDAEAFADTIKQACADAMKRKELKEAIRGRIVFIRCACSVLYGLKPAFILADEDKVGRHVCPHCLENVLKVGEDVAFDDGWGTPSERLLPEGVIRQGEGRQTHYTDLDGKLIDLRG